MPDFHVRQVAVPLFGVVEVPVREPFHGTFADATWPEGSWRIDDDVLDNIAVEFDEDLEGSASELRRYCSGRFRSKTKGPSGNRLGTIGEALVWLSLDGPSGKLLRVVDWKPAGGTAIKGVRYVQPDFIERDGSVDAAVEVKSTEQVQFRHMTEVRNWQQILACAGVAACRSAALEQLGASGTPTPLHRLELQGGEIIPFPVGRGSAIAVLARDGRIDTLRADPRYKTPPACRTAKPARDCWRCMAPNGNNADLTLVRMDNSPDRLPLVGGGGERAAGWTEAYFQWTRALWARDEGQVGRRARELAGLTEYWLDEALPRGADPVPLLAFWGSYLLDAASQRGLAGAAAESPLPTLADWAGENAWSRCPPEEPASQTVAPEQFGSSPAFLSRGQLRRLRIQPSSGAQSVLVDIDSNRCESRVLDPEISLRQEMTLPAAEKLAAQAAAAALVAAGWLDPGALTDTTLRVPLRKVYATLGEARRDLGWALIWQAPEESEPYHYIRAWWHYLRHPFWRPFRFEWGFPLGPGPALRVRVTRSGRAVATCEVLDTRERFRG